MIVFDLGLDLFPLLAATLASVGCAVLGNFLVLRKLSLMGDAISHSVLPGLVIAFLVTSSRNPVAMMIGAGIAGIATVLLVEIVKKLGRVESGAAMGVVFSVLFALGVLLIETQAVHQIDLDAECVLHGQLETLAWWDAPDSFTGLMSMSTFDAVPRQVVTLAIMTLLALGFVGMFFKELRISAFDPQLATTQGYNATLMHGALMTLVAGATVASFEAVGSILVIAMLICPAATARMLTDRLKIQVILSIVIAIGSAVLGYLGASVIPGLLGKDAVNAAGSIAVMSGVLLTLSILASPSRGVIARMIRSRTLSSRIAREDLLATLYRARERGDLPITLGSLREESRLHDRTLSRAFRAQLIEQDAGGISLTSSGEDEAARIVRRHRLWERYLVDQAGLSPDHVHDAAETLEHTELEPPRRSDEDPHGRAIP
jgi:manganese/zinc/iron transport system permease protein